MARTTLTLVAMLVAMLVALSAPALAHAQEARTASREVASREVARGELVVVLHGMGRTSRSMAPVEDALQRAGYDVLNIGYSSTCCRIAELAANVRRELDEKRRPEHHTVHFVGHSLGGIIARSLISENPPSGMGRLVMLAPPNQGSQAADFFSPVIDWLLEPIDELRTDSAATVHNLKPLTNVDVGVIAGRHDGKLSVEQTHLDGESGHVVVNSGHTFIMRRDDVLHLMLAFLRDGRFPLDSAVAGHP
jgi:triacylglycerol lipase